MSKYCGITAAVLAAAGTIALLALSWSLISKDVKAVSQRTAYFSASGKVYAKPDTAEATFGVSTQNADSKAAVAENNKTMDTIVTYLKSSGIKPEDIQTTNYSLYPQYDYNYCNTVGEVKTCTPKINGYQIDQSVTFKSKDFAKMAEVLSGLAERGANNISNLVFTIEDPEVYRSAARKIAIDRAKEKARNFAEDADFDLGRLTNITEDYNTPGPVPYFDKGMGGGGAVTSAPIEAGNQEVVVNVNLTYEIR